MRKIMLAAVSVAMAGAAHAAPVPVIQYTPGVYTIPASTSAGIFEKFIGGVPNTAYNPATQSSGPYTQTTSGNVLSITGNVPGDGISPAPGANTYLAIQSGGLFNVAFGTTGVQVLSFVFGTLDTYNTLRLTFNDATTQLFTGREIVGLPNTQVNPSTYPDTGRVTYDTKGLSSITSVQFGSTGFDAFEIDDLAAAVPEPATWLMMILGFGVVGGAMRTRRHKTTVSFA